MAANFNSIGRDRMCCERGPLHILMGRLSHQTSVVLSRVFVIVAKTLFLWVLTAPCWAGDNAEEGGSADASLEELLNIRLVSSGILGIHHTHPKGEWMISYRYMTMRMAGNRIGSDRVTDSEVLRDYMVAPTDMNMDMHMVGVMYAPTQDLTVMGMVPYLNSSMNHVTRMGDRFATESEGLGDVKFSALYTFYQAEDYRLHLDAGVSFPTGSIDEKGNTPAGANQRLPYPMQLGSGTYDPNIGITYLAERNNLSWGGRGGGVFRLGRNSRDYRLGNHYVLDAWAGYRWSRWLSSSVRTTSAFWGNIEGADPALNPRMVPTANPQLRGGKQLDLTLGQYFFVPEGKLFGSRLAVEVMLPLYQSLEGPQLATDWVLSLGWQYIWKF